MPGPRLSALGLLIVVAVVDFGMRSSPPRLWLIAPLDWTGHLATTGLALLSAHRFGLRPPRRRVIIVLASSVLIDLDHAPLYLGMHQVAAAGGRPFTHSLLTVAVIALVAALSRQRDLAAVASGVTFHFLRDLATGPGLPLLWPLPLVAKIPYPIYGGILIALALSAGLPRASVSDALTAC